MIDCHGTADRRFYVYGLFRPWDGSPCYIGKGTGERLFVHERRQKSHWNPYLRGIFIRAKRLGLVVPASVIRGGLTQTEALELEILLIGILGRRHSGGPLVNLTDGGEGSRGRMRRVVSEETRRKISEAKRGRVMYFPSAQTKAKITASLKGKPWSDLRRANQSAAQKKSDARRAVSDKLRGVPLSDETKTKISAAKKGIKQSDAKRAATSLAIREWWLQRKAIEGHNGTGD